MRRAGMHPGTILIRADANVEIGTGHVMRCLALAQAWQDAGGTAEFAMAESTPAIRGRLAGFRVSSVQATAGTFEDAGRTTEMARANGAGWIVADGYSFGRDYQRTIKDAGLKLLGVDDNAEAGSFFADVVLNQNLHAHASLYPEREPGTRLLLGPKYALLRREFKAWRGRRREIPAEAQRMLVTMGGSDALNLSERVIRAIQLLGMAELETTVVAGGSNPHITGLRALAEESGGRLRLVVDANNMPELMAWADIAVSASGSTCWEMGMLGLPAILLDVAPNQLPLARELERQGIALHLPLAQATVEHLAERIEFLIHSSHLRSGMSRRAAELVDGNGAARVVTAMNAQAITMRRAQPGDCRVLWEWASDTAVRQASFVSAPISWEQHGRWFAEKLGDPSSVLLMFEDEHFAPVGTARFHSKTGADAEISVTIAPDFRSQGLASHLLDRAVEHLFEQVSMQRVHAFIRAENRASSKSFENAGFFLVGTTQVRGNEALHYVREREQSAAEVFGGWDKTGEMARCR